MPAVVFADSKGLEITETEEFFGDPLTGFPQVEWSVSMNGKLLQGEDGITFTVRFIDEEGESDAGGE
jgi:hypothetical protein